VQEKTLLKYWNGLKKEINFDELDAEKSMVMPFVLSLLF
jgi:hypothetical protein